MVREIRAGASPSCGSLTGCGPRRPTLVLELAYLEGHPPSLEDAAARLATGGARSIRVVPLFFGRGGHLREDVPRRVAAIATAIPGVAIEVTLPAGDDDAVQTALAAFCLRAARGA